MSSIIPKFIKSHGWIPSLMQTERNQGFAVVQTVSAHRFTARINSIPHCLLLKTGIYAPIFSQPKGISSKSTQTLYRHPGFAHSPRQSVPETQPNKCSTIIIQIPQLRPKLSQANTFSATIIQSLTRVPKFLTDSKSVTTRINQIHSPRQSVRETQPKNCATIITQIPQLRPKLSQANAFSATIIQSFTRIPKFLTDSKSVTTRINQIPRPPLKVSRSPISSLPGFASHSHRTF